MKCFILILAFVCVASAKFFIGGKNDIYSWDKVQELCKKDLGWVAEPKSVEELTEMSELARTKKPFSLMFTGIRNANGEWQYSNGTPVDMDIPCKRGCVAPAFWSYGQNPVDTKDDFQKVQEKDAIFSLVTPICEK